MFQTFSGSSRRPRQVNLSGSNQNPFKKSAVAAAQEERAQRQHERDRLQAAKLLQRTWRGHTVRRNVNNGLRQVWDATEEGSCGSGEGSTAYPSLEKDWKQLGSLLRFCNVYIPHDLARLEQYCRRHALTLRDEKSGSGPQAIEESRIAHLRLVKLLLSALSRIAMDNHPADNILRALVVVLRSDPTVLTLAPQLPWTYYSILPRVIADQSVILDAVILPLKQIHGKTLGVYEAFCMVYLAWLDYDTQWDLLEKLGDQVNYKLLDSALATALSQYDVLDKGTITIAGSRYTSPLRNTSERLRLLGYFVYFHRHTHQFTNPEEYSSDPNFVTVISRLLASVVDEINLDDRAFGSNDDAPLDMKHDKTHIFLREQIWSLVDEKSVRGLLTPHQSTSSERLQDKSGNPDMVRLLAAYALTLLRCFPSRSDDIRMWLYLGSTSVSQPAIPYFWQAARNTAVFQRISVDPREAVALLSIHPGLFYRISDDPKEAASLVPAQPGTHPVMNTRGGAFSWEPPDAEIARQREIEDEWRVILTFFELYTVVLKVMDDEEFLSGGSATSSATISTMARANALPLTEVDSLTTFLKNLGFTLCFNGVEIISPDWREILPGKYTTSHFGKYPTPAH